MKKTLKVGQRVKYRSLRGTVLSISILPLKVKSYEVKLDNGVFASGTDKQLSPVYRRLG